MALTPAMTTTKPTKTTQTSSRSTNLMQRHTLMCFRRKDTSLGARWASVYGDRDSSLSHQRKPKSFPDSTFRDFIHGFAPQMLGALKGTINGLVPAVTLKADDQQLEAVLASIAKLESVSSSFVHSIPTKSDVDDIISKLLEYDAFKAVTSSTQRLTSSVVNASYSGLLDILQITNDLSGLIKFTIISVGVYLVVRDIKSPLLKAIVSLSALIFVGANVDAASMYTSLMELVSSFVPQVETKMDFSFLDGAFDHSFTPQVSASLPGLVFTILSNWVSAESFATPEQIVVFKNFVTKYLVRYDSITSSMNSLITLTMGFIDMLQSASGIVVIETYLSGDPTIRKFQSDLKEALVLVKAGDNAGIGKVLSFHKEANAYILAKADTRNGDKIRLVTAMIKTVDNMVKVFNDNHSNSNQPATSTMVIVGQSRIGKSWTLKELTKAYLTAPCTTVEEIAIKQRNFDNCVYQPSESGKYMDKYSEQYIYVNDDAYATPIAKGAQRSEFDLLTWQMMGGSNSTIINGASVEDKGVRAHIEAAFLLTNLSAGAAESYSKTYNHPPAFKERMNKCTFVMSVNVEFSTPDTKELGPYERCLDTTKVNETLALERGGVNFDHLTFQRTNIFTQEVHGPTYTFDDMVALMIEQVRVQKAIAAMKRVHGSNTAISQLAKRQNWSPEKLKEALDVAEIMQIGLLERPLAERIYEVCKANLARVPQVLQTFHASLAQVELGKLSDTIGTFIKDNSLMLASSAAFLVAVKVMWNCFGEYISPSETFGLQSGSVTRSERQIMSQKFSTLKTLKSRVKSDLPKKNDIPKNEEFVKQMYEVKANDIESCSSIANNVMTVTISIPGSLSTPHFQLIAIGGNDSIFMCPYHCMTSTLAYLENGGVAKVTPINKAPFFITAEDFTGENIISGTADDDETDVAVFQILSAPKFKNIDNKFPSAARHLKIAAGWSSNDNMFMVVPSLSKNISTCLLPVSAYPSERKYSSSITSNGEVQTVSWSRGYIIRKNTTVGECGSPYVGSGGVGILAMHVAGTNQCGLGITISREHIDFCHAYFSEAAIPQMGVSHPVVVQATIPLPFHLGSVSMISSVMADAYRESGRKLPVEVVPVVPTLAAIRNVLKRPNDAYEVNPVRLSLVVNNFKKMVYPYAFDKYPIIRELTIPETINGCEMFNIPAMSRTTSSGNYGLSSGHDKIHLFGETGSDLSEAPGYPTFYQEIEFLIEELAAGRFPIRAETVMKPFPKANEVRPPGKEARIVYCATPHLNVLSRKFFGAASVAIKSPGILAGYGYINPYTDGPAIVSHLSAFKNPALFGDRDGKKWDHTVNHEIFRAATDMMIDMTTYSSSKYQAAAITLAKFLAAPYIGVPSETGAEIDIVTFCEGMTSGVDVTSVINSSVNSIAGAYSITCHDSNGPLHHMDKVTEEQISILEGFKQVVHGDDSVYSIDSGYADHFQITPQSAIQAMNDIGFNISAGDKSAISDFMRLTCDGKDTKGAVTFLQRRFVHKDGTIVMPLEAQSIEKQLVFSDKASTKLTTEQLTSRWNEFLAECAIRGEEYYDDISAIVVPVLHRNLGVFPNAAISYMHANRVIEEEMSEYAYI